jgi:hypothetical protein
VLRDPAVVDKVVDFVAAKADSDQPARDDAARLEWALFNRDERW